MQAKVAQEIVIAKRIAEADKVHIEEYYEGEVEAHLGLKTDGANNISLGMGGKKNKIYNHGFREKSYNGGYVNQFRITIIDLSCIFSVSGFD